MYKCFRQDLSKWRAESGERRNEQSQQTTVAARPPHLSRVPVSLVSPVSLHTMSPAAWGSEAQKAPLTRLLDRRSVQRLPQHCGIVNLLIEVGVFLPPRCLFTFQCHLRLTHPAHKAALLHVTCLYTVVIFRRGRNVCVVTEEIKRDREEQCRKTGVITIFI